jgi:hypothetical protein
VRRREPLEHLGVDDLAHRDAADRRARRRQLGEMPGAQRAHHDGQADLRPDVVPPAEDAVLLLDGREQLVELADVLRRPQE